MRPSLPSLIEVEASRHRIFRDRLLAEIPNLDEETLGDTLEGIVSTGEEMHENDRFGNAKRRIGF